MEPAVGSELRKREPGLGQVSQDEVRFSPLVKALGWFEGAARGLGLSPFALERAALLKMESLKPWSSVLGDERELESTWELARAFCSGVDANPHLSTFGRLLARSSTLSGLDTLAAFLKFFHENQPFIRTHGRVRAPIVVAGVARTGTTLLHGLLSQDPQARAPLAYELQYPTPPLTRESDPARDPRIEKMEKNARVLERLAPGALQRIMESHALSPTQPEECLTRMVGLFGTGAGNALLAGRDYLALSAAAQEAQLAPAMRLERLFIQTLDAYRPATRWVLKSPWFAGALHFLFQEIPDARVIMTHRDPLVTLPSLCRLGESWYALHDRPGRFDKRRFGPMVAEQIGRGLTASIEFREKNPDKEGQIVDCMYGDLVADPLGTVRRIYDHFGLDYTGEFDERCRRYLREHPQGARGRHRYSLEEYGLDAGIYTREHEAYMRRFGFGSAAWSA